MLPPGIACGLGPDELQLGLQIYEVLFQCQRLLVVNSEQNRYLSPDTSCWPPSYFFKLFIKTTHTLQRKRETGSLCRGSRWHRSEPQTVFLNSPFPGSLCPAPVFLFFFFDRKKKKASIDTLLKKKSKELQDFPPGNYKLNGEKKNP